MSEVRQVRANGAPLSFRVPPGWPAPLEIWVLMNQGWELPRPTWVPREGVPQAPSNWRFWDSTPLFEEIVGALNQSHNRRIAWGSALLIIGLLFSASTPLFLLMSVWGGWRIISGLGRRSGSRDQAMQAVRVNAIGVRQEVLSELYGDYRRDTGSQ